VSGRYKLVAYLGQPHGELYDMVRLPISIKIFGNRPGIKSASNGCSWRFARERKQTIRNWRRPAWRISSAP